MSKFLPATKHPQNSDFVEAIMWRLKRLP